MSENLCVRGCVATEPRHVTTEGGVPITSFRLVNRPRRFGRQGGRGSDGEVNWFTVTAFGPLAVSAAASVATGDPVVVTGWLSVREWLGDGRLRGGPCGATAEIEAEAIGHDLAWGRSVFTRTIVETTLSAPFLVDAAETGGLSVLRRTPDVSPGRSP